MSKKSIKSIFKVNKPVIGMLHIDDLLGAPNFKSIDYLVSRAKKDIKALQDGGVDGILIENWKEDSIGEFVSPETAISFTTVVSKIAGDIKIPFGFNVLNNDYKVALTLAKLYKADFVEFDVFVDHVKSDFKYSPISSKHPFEVNVNPKNIHDYAKKIGASDIPMFVFVQPKHYLMLEKNKSIETSTKQAQKNGAAAALVTKETGTAPTLDLITRAKKAASIPVGIGSGLSIENVEEYLAVADFGVIGTALKKGNITDNPVDPKKVKTLMQKVKKNFR